MNIHSYTKKVLIVGLFITLLIPTFPQRSHAQFVDAANLVQNTITAIGVAADHTLEYVLDTLAWQAANLAIESMTKSLVNWINSGFQGSPAFVTDLKTNLRGVGDAVASQFFSELTMATADIQLSPFQDRVVDAVRLGYYLHTSPESFYTRYPYTLNQVSPDARAFLQGDFSQGGWNAWFATVMNPQNNPYGAQELAERALSSVVSSATNNRVQELSWNRGFLSWRGDCTMTASQADTPDGMTAVDLSGEDKCVSFAIETPGSVIEEQLNRQLGSGSRRLEVADEFNEIIGALLNQLVLQVVGGGSGGGLRGVSRPSTTGGGSFLNNPTGTDATEPGTNPVTTVAPAFTATVANQRAQITNYQSSWQRIQGVAQSAAARCPVATNPNPQEVLTRASQQLVRAANALAGIVGIEQQIAQATAAAGNQTAAFLAISEAYNALIFSADFPDATALAEAGRQSQDTGDTEPASLYTQLSRMANGSCDGT